MCKNALTSAKREMSRKYKSGDYNIITTIRDEN